MSNKMALEYPYTTKWKVGYLVTNGENRKHVCLVGGSSRTTTSYARYLMAVHLGRFLESHEHVDHIDEDKTNDVIDNIQLLSRNDNTAKHYRLKGKLMAEIRCPVCSLIFIRRTGNTQAVNSKKGSITCCSKRCSSLFQKTKRTKQEMESISKSTLIRIFRLKGET